MKKNLILAFSVMAVHIAGNAWAEQKTATIIAYYPSANGVYSEFRLYPNSGPHSPCDAEHEGVIYYDSSKNKFRVCIQDQNGNFIYSDPCFVKGMAQVWSGGSRLPDGWQLCDGSRGTKDLRSLFIKGSNVLGQHTSGGSNSMSLGEEYLPAHTHHVSGSGTAAEVGLHNHRYSVRDSLVDKVCRHIIYNLKNCNSRQSGNEHDGNHTHTLQFSVDSGGAGGSAPFNNQPKFYKLAYICYVGD